MSPFQSNSDSFYILPIEVATGSSGCFHVDCPSLWGCSRGRQLLCLYSPRVWRFCCTWTTGCSVQHPKPTRLLSLSGSPGYSKHDGSSILFPLPVFLGQALGWLPLRSLKRWLKGFHLNTKRHRKKLRVTHTRQVTSHLGPHLIEFLNFIEWMTPLPIHWVYSSYRRPLRLLCEICSQDSMSLCRYESFSVFIHAFWQTVGMKSMIIWIWIMSLRIFNVPREDSVGFIELWLHL